MKREQRTQPPANPVPKVSRPPLVAKTDGKLKLIRAIKASSQVIVTGPAGTGKSYIPAITAADWLAEGKVEKIVLDAGKMRTHLVTGFKPRDAQGRV